MGNFGRQYIIDNFIITRLMLDWMELIIDYLTFPKNIGYLSNRIISKINGEKKKN